MRRLLRHPVRAIREPFGTAGLIVACVALIAALGGTALAAAKLNGTQKKEVEKIAKKYAGRSGANGAPGANGAAGATGPAGPAGKNGTNGKEGSEGSPWTAGGTLPSGQTEKGDWGLTGNGTEFGDFSDPVSFVIPLKAVPTVHYIRSTGKEPFYNAGTSAEEEQVQPECPGTYAEPTATSGNLCIYAAAEENTYKNLEEFGHPGTILPTACSMASPSEDATDHSYVFGCLLDHPGKADKYGFDVFTVAETEGAVFTVGTWAVTG